MTRGPLTAFALLGAMFAAATFAAPVALANACDPASIVSSVGEKRGCCSHHNGVCGCNSQTGMQRCCDGTDSPSCKCGE